MYVHSLQLSQIKAFESLDLAFLRPKSEKPYAGLNVFVGGNASGKTTLLKSLAMALMGGRNASQLNTSLNGWIREGVHDAEITASLVPSEHDATPSLGRRLEPKPYFSTLRAEALNSSRTLFYGWGSNSDKSLVDAFKDANGWFLAAYGPFRRLSGSSVEVERYTSGPRKLSSCVTLFREDAALAESDVWLRQEHARELERKDQGEAVSGLVSKTQEFLNSGLMPEGFKITRVTVDEVFLETPNGGELPLRDLSDGIRSAYALALDIIHHMTRAYGTTDLFAMSEAGYPYVRYPGVVLIDELEAHLHPSWQQRICEWLKTRFPNIQFFVTTHSPLIAQAADPGGLFVLPLPDEIASGQTVRRLEPHEQERVALGRAEKVLLGQAFGLKRTWSDRAERLVQRWEQLAAERNAKGKLPAKQQREFEELSEKVEIIFDDVSDEVGSA